MTPSRRIETQTELIWNLIGSVSGKLGLAMVRRKVSRNLIKLCASALKEASEVAEDLAVYMENIKEN